MQQTSLRRRFPTPNGKLWLPLALILIAILLFCFKENLRSQPAGFSDNLWLGGWDEVVGFTWDANGRTYVWERKGKVWLVENGVKLPTPLLDISEEVGGWRDFGLLGFALDPNFLSNGYFYLLYVVDRHHLLKFGTGQYSSTTNEYFAATIGRITRYQANVATNYTSVVAGSRTVLFGETVSTGNAVLHESHGTGSLAFGQDGTLLASLGDGASYNGLDEGSAADTYFAQALTDGIITSAQNIGTYRSQSLSSFNGKLLRLDPATGDGLPSNPNWNAAQPRSVASRTWARGLRNPYRITHVPETGSHNPAAGNPGVFILGDVGMGSREEMDVVNAANLNFGWPKFEGMTFQPGFNNPTYAPSPHTLPKVDWRTGTPRGFVNGNIVNVGSATLPGPTFLGNASVGGTWYHANDFPATWHDTYFHADYGEGWIRNFRFDANWNPVEVRNFVSTAGACVFVGTHPTQGGIWYARFPDQIRRVTFTGTTQRAPVAFASANVSFGASPLAVTFSSFNTYDQDGGTLTYLWNFGDGTTSTQPNPTKTFNSGNSTPTGYTVTLTVTDNTGLTGTATLKISVNNQPPDIAATSLDAVSTFNPNATTNQSLSATVADPNHAAGQLSHFWEVLLFHNEHSHPVQTFTTATASVSLTPIDCYNASYWYRVKLTVTDPAGLSDFFQKDIFPACAGTSQTLSFSTVSDKIVGAAPFNLTASASSGLPVTFYVTEGPATVLGSTVTLTGVPGRVTIAATQPGNGTFAPAQNVERSFWVNVSQTPQNQAINFPVIPNKLTSDPPFQLTATASSGLPVSYQILSGPATVSGGTVTLTGQAGTVTVRASQAGNASWNPATPVDRTFTVTQQSGGTIDLSLSVTNTPANLTIYNNISFTFALTNSGTATATNVRVFLPKPSTVVWVGNNEFTVSQGTFDYTGAKVWYVGNLAAGANATVTVNWFVLATDPLTGWAEVSAADQTDSDSTPANGTPGVANEDDEAAKTVTVPGQGPQNQTISFLALPAKETDDPPFAVTASATSGLPVSFQIVSGPATISGNTVTLSGQTGVVTVRATQAGNASWNPAPPVEQSFVVNPPGLQNQTITFGTLANKLTTDPPFNLSATASSGLPVTFSVQSGPATISGNTVTLTGQPGSVTIRASQAGNATYNPAPNVDRTFQVTLPGGGSGVDLKLTMTASAQNVTQWQNIGFTATLTNEGTATATGVKVHFPKPASVVFTGGNEAVASTGTYAVFTDQQWTVGNMAPGASQTLTLNFFVLQNAPLTAYAQVSAATPTDNDSAPNNGTPPTPVEDDEAAFTAGAPGSGPQNQTITFNPLANKVTTDPPFTLSATASSGLPVSFTLVSGPATLSGNTVTLTGSTGTVTVRATQAGNASWNAATPVDRSFTVSAPGLQNQTITFNPLPNKLTTDPPFNLSATASSGLPVSFSLVSGPATLSANTVTLTGQTGTVTLRASQAGNATYNPAPDLTRSFGVNLPGGSQPDLELSLASSGTTLTIWQNVTFTFTLTNAGTAQATGIRVAAPIPQGLAHTSNTPASGTSYNLFTHEWEVGTLAAGGSKTLTLVLFVLQNTTPLPYFVQVKAATPADVDSSPNNNATGTPAEDDEALVTLTPPGQAALGLNPPSGGQGGEVFSLFAKQEGATAKLRWSTNCGENCLHYVLERSPNGFEWTPLATVQNEEPTDAFATYRLTDERPQSGWNFYRIVQLRDDGKLAFSNVQMLEFWEDLDEFKLFPNPAGEYVDVNLAAVEGQIVRLILVDRQGRLVREMEVAEAPAEPYRIDLQGIAGGYYVVWIQAAGRRARALPLIVGE